MSTPESTLRFGLIGCGRISQVHLQCLSKDPQAKLVAVADVDAKATASTAEAFGVKGFQDAQKMVTEMNLDAVIICSPPNSHHALSDLALNSGVHVLCEKPLSLSVAEAETTIGVAKQKQRVLMMASKFRYVQDIIRAKNIMESGILGEVILVENEFCSRVDMKNRWNAKYDVAGGGVLIDNGSHSVDIIRYLVGPIRDLQAIHGKKWQQLEVEDTCQLFVRCADGTMASIDLSWSIHKENPFFIHVYGTAGTLEIGWKNGRYRQSEKLDWVNFGSGYDKFQAVGSQLRNFIQTIRGEDRPLITPEDAIESVRVVQSAYRSASHNQWEKVTG
ncbi:MAG TPA: Gfo/Idh/MocA family oxidoreductase [Bacteroidota bacterium]|nr:Gfo/Idh/MocA family oxidoreductase [Bacteroidota bacterium]